MISEEKIIITNFIIIYDLTKEKMIDEIVCSFFLYFRIEQAFIEYLDTFISMAINEW